jgi:hypothetical protein
MYPEELRKFEPLKVDHPLVADRAAICPGCHLHFYAGDVITLIPVGPGDNSDERARARAGQPYNAVSIPVHWACATGEE